MRWDELLDLQWEAEWTCMQADWEVQSAVIDLDGERKSESWPRTGES